MNKTVLVTGAAGFVGSNLVPLLLEDGFKVVAFDNLSQGFMRNIEPFLENERFQFVEGDVCDQKALLDLQEDFSHIVHLAAFKIPRYGNALKTLQVNSHGTEHVLELARKQKSCKVLFSSTSDVYGRNPELPFSEQSVSVIGEPTVKRWAYAVSKMYDEHLCLAYAEEFGLPVSIVRYFGSYGPGQNTTWWGGPQSVFMQAILDGKPLTVHGDGKQTRSFTFVKDTVYATFLALTKDEANGQVINIGNNYEITIKELAEKVWSISGEQGEAPIEMIPYQSFSGKYEDVRRRVPDLSKAKELLGFTPQYDLDTGLKATWQWQKQLDSGLKVNG